MVIHSTGKDLLMTTFELYDWQVNAFGEIRNRNAVLSAPTGSGKTLVAYLWAGLLGIDGKVRNPGHERIIFTAPIKALSNERYMDLRKLGFDVGIETGDFKRNSTARILCCTQEIYTLKYSSLPDQKLIIDEFHYIFSDPHRARAYIDGIGQTDASSRILVMSATFGGTSSVGEYLSRLTHRNFLTYENHQRVTKLVFNVKKGLKLEKIHDALLFVFSQKGASMLAFRLARKRKRVKSSERHRLYEIARILGVDNVPMPLLRGVGIYHGGMLPKEKLLAESAFRERIIDVVVGTNALALGVNLPAEYAIFGQLVMYHNREPISKNDFLQMAGRAGRKGLFDTGYVTWLTNSPCEQREANTAQIFRRLTRAQPERATVSLRPAYGKLLRKEVSIHEEASYIAKCSLPVMDPDIISSELGTELKKIDRGVRKLVSKSERKQFRLLLADIWYEEMTPEENLEMGLLFFYEDKPHALVASEILSPYERNFLQALLKIKRYANRLPRGYNFSGMDQLDKAIEDMDETIFGFEEKIGEIEQSAV